MTAGPELIVHATLVAHFRSGAWRGALLRGPSGSGKSGLALAAMASGWRLVADDRVQVWASGGRLFGKAPERLEGLVEARGLGVLATPHLPLSEIVVVIDLAAAPGGIERLPELQTTEMAGLRLPRAALFPQESSAVAKLALALEAAPLGARAEEAYQARSH